jgi:hypothetical protein
LPEQRILIAVRRERMIRINQRMLEDWAKGAIQDYVGTDIPLEESVRKTAKANDLNTDQVGLLAQTVNVRLRVSQPSLKFAAVDPGRVIETLQISPLDTGEAKAASVRSDLELSGTRETMFDKYLADRGAMVKAAERTYKFQPSDLLILAGACEEKIASARRSRAHIVSQLRETTSHFVDQLSKEAMVNGTIDKSYTSVMSVRGEKIVDDLFKAAHESLSSIHRAEYTPPRFVKLASVMDPRHPLLQTVDEYVKLAYRLCEVEKEINKLTAERDQIGILVKKAYGTK